MQGLLPPSDAYLIADTKGARVAGCAFVPASRERSAMCKLHLVGALFLVASVLAPTARAQVSDLSKYPDFSTGQWRRPEGGGPRYDPSKPARRGQQAPLTPEYQARYEANLKDQAAGGQGLDQTYRCIPSGMPRHPKIGPSTAQL
jgi:hypothetical protein